MFTVAYDLKTHYQKIGSGPVMVLLHGWGCDWQIWHPVVSELSKSFQLIIPDLPAFGQTDVPQGSTWNSHDYANWLEEFLQEVVGKKKIILVGHSLGGKVASLYTTKKSGRQKVKKLVLVDAAGLPDDLSLSQMVKLNIIKLIPGVFKQALPLVLKRRILGAVGVSQDHLNANPNQKIIIRNLVREDISQALVEIKTSTLIIWGAKDKETPLEQGRKFEQLIIDSKLVIFENSGHFPFIEETPKFIKELTEDL